MEPRNKVLRCRERADEVGVKPRIVVAILHRLRKDSGNEGDRANPSL
jgi:hypothetical protein